MKKNPIAVCLLLTMVISLIFSNGKPAEAAVTISNIQQILDILGIMETDDTKNLSLTREVSRAQYAQMLVNLSSYRGKTAKNSKVSLFKDVKKTHWAAAYIKTAIDEGWMNGYLNGSFKPKQAVTLQEAVNGIVKILGYQNSDFTGSIADAKMAFYSTKKLNEGISKTKTQAMTVADCMHLFYNTLKTATREGKPYGEGFGCVFGSDGEINYLGTLNKEMEGPVVTEGSWSGVLSFTNESTVYYRNGNQSGKGDISTYDVIYYSSKLNRVWAYSDKITGTLKEVLPNNIAPTSIKVAGKEYPLETEESIYSVSSYGSFQKGDVVTLLLGKDGSVASIRKGDSLNQILYGVVLETGDVTKITEPDAGLITTYVKMVDTAGQEHTYECDTEGIKKGELVRINCMDDIVKAESITQVGIYGEIDAKNLKMGDMEIAPDIRILDYKEEKYKTIPLSRLDGVSLTYGNVWYYARNDKGKITDMILTDGTGDLNTYGIITGVKDTDSTEVMAGAIGQSFSYRLSDGTEGSFATEEVFLRPVIYEFDYSNLRIIGGSPLASVTVTGISGLTVQNGNNQYMLSDEAGIYYVDNNNKAFNIELSKISDLKKYNLTAYYDRPASQGGRVRAIIAESRH